MKAPAIYRIDQESGEKREIIREAVSGLEFGPDGALYGCQGALNRVIRIDLETQTATVIAENVAPNDLAVSSDGFVYITETKHQRITRIHCKTGESLAVDAGITRPNGIAMSNDGGTLAVSDSGGEHVWTFRVNVDGQLEAKMPSMSLRLAIDPQGDFRFNAAPPYQPASRGDGMAVDKIGRYYVTSALGVQVFDPTGRQCGVLPKPESQAPLTSCVLSGPGHVYLYITHGDRVLRRKVQLPGNN
jgi:enterochelin esterase family protein